MKSLLRFIVLLLILTSCTEADKSEFKYEEKFTSEVIELKEYFQIPGLAISVEKNGENVYQNYLGSSDLDKQAKLDSTALFPIASVTKVFSAVLILKLVEEQKLSLEEPINKYVPEYGIQDSIQVKHILSHTSQGKIGQKFYYSSRFGLLTKVIEQASGKSFMNVMKEKIFEPLGLKNTFLLKDLTQIMEENRVLAKPYVLDNGVESGFIDYGYSTSAGIVSNLQDLATFNHGLDSNILISQSSKELMFSSFKKDLPYGYGIFSQKFENLNIVWAYGQYDCYSSLFLKIPSEDIALTLLANNNLLSDPARLIYGDVTSSLFVMSFLKNYVFQIKHTELFEPLDSISKTDSSETEFYRKKLLAEALAESYMARFEPQKIQSSAALLGKVFREYPNYLEYADLNLLHNLSFLKDVAFYMELDEFTQFDTQIVQIGEKLLNEDRENPYANSYMGVYYARKGDSNKAKHYFERIVNAKNFSENWYTREAQDWLDGNN